MKLLIIFILLVSALTKISKPDDSQQRFLSGLFTGIFQNVGEVEIGDINFNFDQMVLNKG